MIDVSILSSYMGRWLTGLVALFVFVVTGSALLTGGHDTERNVINVCVPKRISGMEAVRAFEPFRDLLRQQTRRPVVLSVCESEWPADHDVYVMHIHEYLRHGEPLGIIPLYEVKLWEREGDSAVIIGKYSGQVDYSAIGADQIAFSDSLSLNAFLIQLFAMEERGFVPPARLSELRFESSTGDESRIVFGVIHGSYRLGACRMSTLSSLRERGIIRPGELAVLYRQESLPEIIVAVHTGEAEYYRRKLRALDGVLEKDFFHGSYNTTVELLKSFGIKGLQPIDAKRVDEAIALYARLEQRF